MNVVMPMAGKGSRFAGTGDHRPKPLVLVGGHPMFAWALLSLSGIPYSRVIVVALEVHEREFGISDILPRYVEGATELVTIQDVTEGQLCTVFAARELINREEDLLVMSSDTYVESNLGADIQRRASDCHGLIAVINVPGDRWSFAKADAGGRVTAVSEKVRISDHASTGQYYFSNGAEFVSLSEEMIARKEKTGGEYYVMPLYRKYLERGLRIDISRATEMWDMGTPDAFRKFDGLKRPSLPDPYIVSRNVWHPVVKQPRFSICIPNYNYGRFIGATIESVLAQSYPHFEIVVADNASTDNSVDVVKSYRDRRIRLIRNPYNVGFSPNLDRAASQAKGDYIIMLSSDDIMKPEALAEYAEVIRQFKGLKEDLVILSGCDIIDSQGVVTGTRVAMSGDILDYANSVNARNSAAFPPPIEVFQGLELFKALARRSLTTIGKFLTTCYPRSLYERVGGYSSVMSIIPDAHFSHKLCLQNPKMIYLNKNLFQYRVHTTSNYASLGSNIKLICDFYQLTHLYSDAELARAGVSRDEVRKAFVTYWCVKQPFWSIVTGRRDGALKRVLFGLASFPGIAVRDVRFYINLLLAPFSPLFWMLRKVALRLRR